MGDEHEAPKAASTTAERLDALLRRANPGAVAEHERSGKWPGGQAPYSIHTVPTGRRVSLTLADGDVVNGLGPTVADAVAALEKKLG